MKIIGAKNKKEKKVSRIYDMTVLKEARWLAIVTMKGLISLDLNLLVKKEEKDIMTREFPSELEIINSSFSNSIKQSACGNFIVTINLDEIIFIEVLSKCTILKIPKGSFG